MSHIMSSTNKETPLLGLSGVVGSSYRVRLAAPANPISAPSVSSATTYRVRVVEDCVAWRKDIQTYNIHVLFRESYVCECGDNLQAVPQVTRFLP